MRNSILTAVLLISNFFYGQNKLPYQLYDKEGQKTTYEQLLKATLKTEVLLFGEHHDNSIVHWLQLELTKDVFEKRPLVLGAEMIEADNQTQLDDYVKGTINQKAFDSLARLWPNHKTDYKPLVDFAKEKKIAFVATNIPRRYARMVSKQGFEVLDTLSVAEKAWIAPLPIAYDKNLPGYVNMMEMMGEHASENMPKAQAIKDATMAYFIVENLKKDTVFIHFNGTYHSDNFEGIFWYLKKANQKLKILTIAMVTQVDISKLEKEHLAKADFILVVDEDATKTY